MMKKIPLTRGLFAKVDDKDFEWLSRWKWYAYTSGRGEPRYYAGRWGSKGSKVLMHREIIKPPPELDVDHRNGDTLDNRKKNLKKKTRSQNAHGFRRDEHAFTGIRLTGNTFRAGICVNYKRHFKSFNTLEEAQAWRRSMKP